MSNRVAMVTGSAQGTNNLFADAVVENLVLVL